MFDIALARRLARPGPRYTSYPTAPHFRDSFSSEDHARALEGRGQRPISLYVHVPFCAKLCNYCGCHMLVTHRPEKVTRYVEALEREISLVSDRVVGSREVVQVHWGGGTPNSLAPHEIEYVMGALRQAFSFSGDAEISIEADPRTVTPEHLAAARRAGFSRISFGVQSFSPIVQEAIGRVQPFSQVAAVTAQARYEGFSGVSFDLLFGLPHQTLERFGDTVARAIALRPDRLSVFGYAHVPWMKKHQLLLPEQFLPGPEERLALFAHAYDLLTDAGYEAVGMDHFARSDDPLAVAQREGRLHRNFQGYTTRAGDADVIGLGVSAISDLGMAYAQNTKGLIAYYAAIDEDRLPTERGRCLTDEDLLRRDVITRLMCAFEVNKAEVERGFGIDFDAHFADALDELVELEELDVVALSESSITVTKRGRPFVRNAAMAFDAYLKKATTASPRYSQTV